jgi:cobalt/nickel transport protein
MKLTTKLWIGVGILAVVSPIGLILPDKLNAKTAWGEWSSEEVKGLTGYIPAGLQKLSSLWKAVMPDYTFKGWENKGLAHSSLSYVIAAIIGIGLCAGAAFLLGKVLAKRKKSSFPNE